MKILYIEDDPEAREFLQKALARHGHLVDVAEDAATGLEMAVSGAYDLLVVDVMLPDYSGFELLERLRSGGIGTAVLFLTAQGEVTEGGSTASAADRSRSPPCWPRSCSSSSRWPRRSASSSPWRGGTTRW